MGGNGVKPLFQLYQIQYLEFDAKSLASYSMVDCIKYWVFDRFFGVLPASRGKYIHLVQ